MIKAEPTISLLDQALVGFIFVTPLHSLAMQLLYLQENTTASSSELTSKDNNHQRKSEDQVVLPISSISVTNSLNEN